MTERKIKVTPDFFVQLCSYLKPEERWVTDDGWLILKTPYTPEECKLIFVMDHEASV
jgi:hypothetical protein